MHAFRFMHGGIVRPTPF